jgi:hypothetical protein
MAWLRAASMASATKSAIGVQWLVEETIFDRLAQDIEDMGFELGPLIQKQDAMMPQRPLCRYGQLAAAVHANIRSRMVQS